MLCERSDNRLRRVERLRGKGAVDQLFNSGESNFAYPIRYVIQWLDEETKSPVEVLFNVPKRYHRRANKRNLLRRRIKEAYRLNRKNLNIAEFKQPLRIALIYSTKEVLDYQAIERSVNKIFNHLNEIGCGE